METALVVALHEGHGFLRDQGWHQTAQLMKLAATEIERLGARMRELEDRPPPHDHRAAECPAVAA